MVIRPLPNTTRPAEWYKLDVTKKAADQNVRAKIAIRMDKPQNMKHSGFLYVHGKNVFKKWKRRFMILVQVSQYTFAMCSYREKKSDPQEMCTLDGFTIDYCPDAPSVELEVGEPGQPEPKLYFNAVKEGDALIFATDEENDRHVWIQALYRATGQTHKPQPPPEHYSNKLHRQHIGDDKNKDKAAAGAGAGKSSASSSSSSSSAALGKAKGDMERAKKHGLDTYVQADPVMLAHNQFFHLLQRRTLQYRLNDKTASLGWFAPGMVFVLDE